MAAMKVTISAAMRARDVSRPHAEHVADAEAAEATAGRAAGPAVRRFPARRFLLRWFPVRRSPARRSPARRSLALRSPVRRSLALRSPVRGPGPRRRDRRCRRARPGRVTGLGRPETVNNARSRNGPARSARRASERTAGGKGRVVRGGERVREEAAEEAAGGQAAAEAALRANAGNLTAGTTDQLAAGCGTSWTASSDSTASSSDSSARPDSPSNQNRPDQTLTFQARVTVARRRVGWCHMSRR